MKPVVLKWADFSPRGSARTDALEWWAKEIQTRTSGRVSIEFQWAGALAKQADIPEAMRNGIAEMGIVHGFQHPDKFPLLSAGGLPFAGSTLQGMWAGVAAIYESVPEMNKEFEKWNIKFLFPMPSTTWQIQFKTPVKNLAEMQGKKVRAGGDWAKLFSGMGTVPVNIAAAEVYEALQRGTVDGWASPAYVFDTYKTIEVAPNVLMANLGGMWSIAGGINLDVWKKISPDDQKAITQASADLRATYLKMHADEEGVVVDKLKKQKAVFFDMPAADQAKVKELSQPLWTAWAADKEAKGMPGKRVVETYWSAYDKVGR